VARHPGLAQQLLEAEPEAVHQQAYCSWLPLHFAAHHGFGDAAVLRLLLAASPSAAATADACGRLPVHHAARRGYVLSTQQLAAAAPWAGITADQYGLCALQLALRRGHQQAALAIVRALPRAQAADPAAADDAALLQLATSNLEHYHLMMLSILPTIQPDVVLQALSHSGNQGASSPLYADLVRLHAPLTDAQWDMIPAGCLRLGSAATTVLLQPVQQAEQLARRLSSPTDVLCLRRHLLALCLARCQRQLGLQLPPALIRHILSLVD